MSRDTVSCPRCGHRITERREVASGGVRLSFPDPGITLQTGDGRTVKIACANCNKTYEVLDARVTVWCDVVDSEADAVVMIERRSP